MSLSNICKNVKYFVPGCLKTKVPQSLVEAVVLMFLNLAVPQQMTFLRRHGLPPEQAAWPPSLLHATAEPV